MGSSIKRDQEAKEIAQLEDLSSIPKTHFFKVPSMETSQPWTSRDKRVPEAHWPASITELPDNEMLSPRGQMTICKDNTHEVVLCLQVYMNKGKMMRKLLSKSRDDFKRPQLCWHLEEGYLCNVWTRCETHDTMGKVALFQMHQNRLLA